MNIKQQDIQDIIKRQRSYFQTNATKDLAFRTAKLIKLREAIKTADKDIAQALQLDLNKPAVEAYLTETGIVLHELSYMIKHITRFAKQKRVKTGLAQLPATSFIAPEPYGVMLVISPWNYPFQLSLVPLIGSIAAGNCIVLKPSKDAPHTAQVISEIVSKVFAPEHVDMVTGGREENAMLLAQRFDYIFFTGSVAVGKVVMAAASKHLTPVTLELGGKSPVIVDETANLKLAAKRIAFGKLLNAGQTCVAPDYLLVDKRVKQDLIKQLKAEITAMIQTEGKGAQFVQIINQKHLSRLIHLLDGAADVWGGQVEGQVMLPALVEIDSLEHPLMKEEIFGPILPILGFDTLEEAFSTVKRFEKPLALYFFSNDKARQQEALKTLSFGGGCINDTVLHYSNIHLPFGGVGASGMGSYHGKRNFDTFSHARGIVKQATWADVPVRYRPYNRFKEALIRRVLR